MNCLVVYFFFFSSRRRHTRSLCDWSSDVCSSDLWIRQNMLGKRFQQFRRRTPFFWQRLFKQLLAKFLWNWPTRWRFWKLGKLLGNNIHGTVSKFAELFRSQVQHWFSPQAFRLLIS